MYIKYFFFHFIEKVAINDFSLLSICGSICEVLTTISRNCQDA